ncbi:MAG: Ivy family c-type lysozyme inhibitor [Salinisphaera sp.]|jgi:hypothetical protein|nr:Ivy family c-type lysozyme inhibitor [Salinisphaera sp.]
MTVHRFVSSVVLALCVAASGLPVAYAADNQPIYPSQLLKQKPALQAQYDQLIQPITADHAWVKTIGTETPVSQITVSETQYAVLSSCKPHDCAAQEIVSLMSPAADQAVGALLVNHGGPTEPGSSTITWLGQPDASQRQFMAAYLFR